MTILSYIVIFVIGIMACDILHDLHRAHKQCERDSEKRLLDKIEERLEIVIRNK